MEVATQKERSRAWYERNRQTAIDRAAEWKSANKPKVLDSSKRRYRKRTQHHLNVCRTWSGNHPDRKADYTENHRARLFGAFVERVERLIVWVRAEGLCGICGDGVSFREMELDHILAFKQGGKHEYSNCQPAHMTCNRIKARGERAA